MPVVTLENVTPPPRYDGEKYTSARIEESSSYEGPWSVIDTPTFTADPDPARPSTRNFTTDQATLERGYYRVVFTDTTGDEYRIAPRLIISLDVGIASLVRSMMPFTWRALADADYYGLALLYDRIQIAKYRLLPSDLAQQDETGYSHLLRDYVASQAALEIIPAGIEYWMNQKITISATGTNETTSFTDRQRALQDLALRLQAKIAGMKDVVADDVGIRGAGEAAAIDEFDPVLVTADPYVFPEAFEIEARPGGATGGA